MSDDSIGKFLTNIMETLNKNGFPNKKVSLPLEKMYEVAHEKGVSFNKVLDFLKEKGIDHEKTTEKIIFFQKQAAEKIGEFPDILANLNPEMLKNLDMQQAMSQAMEMMKNMSPEQLKNIQSMVGNMTQDQKDNIEKTFAGLFGNKKPDDE